jgi:hypothetical protein
MDEQDASRTVVVPSSAKLTETVYSRIQAIGDKLCSACNAYLWQLTRREISKQWHVYLQCTTCGGAAGPADLRKDHPNWESYPEFDRERQERWFAERRVALKVERESESAKWHAEYDEWRATSTEWPDMRLRVMDRANGLYEACIERRATEVHHRTYDYGHLPPAYLLVAVCRPCHNRFQADGDDWGPRPGPCDRNVAADSVDTDELYDGENPWQ